MDNADHTIEEVHRFPEYVALHRFHIGGPIPGPHNGSEKLARRRVGGGQHEVQSLADEPLCIAKSIHASHRIVTFDKTCRIVDALDLLLYRKSDIHGRIELHSPDAFRAVLDEGSISFFTFPQRGFGLMFVERDLELSGQVSLFEGLQDVAKWTDRTGFFNGLMVRMRSQENDRYIPPPLFKR